jgi:hypothetical protein
MVNATRNKRVALPGSGSSVKYQSTDSKRFSRRNFDSPILKMLSFSFLYFDYPGTVGSSLSKGVVVKRVK